MKHIKTLFKGNLSCNENNGLGCGECQASCQSACKTSCTVANQKCEKEKDNEKIKSSWRKIDLFLNMKLFFLLIFT